MQPAVTAVETGVVIVCLGVLLATLRPRSGLWVQASGLAVLFAGSGGMLLQRAHTGSPFADSASPLLGIDPLSAFFLTVIAATAAPILLYAGGYVPGNPHPRTIAALTGAFVLSLILVTCARSLMTFLAGWELMTLIPAITILAYQSTRPVRRGVSIYIGSTHLAGAGVWLCIILLAQTGAFAHPQLLQAQGPAMEILIWVLAIVGFGTKAGLMPLHSWLPRAHPIAPAHISALMSALMIKVALYGLIRVFFYWSPTPPAWIGVLILAFGAASSVGGVTYALFEHDLKRLLAFHSIENIGIITLGLGASLLFAASGQPLWAAIAFSAALFHVFNHALFKALLFLGSGAIEKSAHSRSIDHLGGLLRAMPWTGVAFLTGCMAIAGLPPLNGFVSEWLTLQSLLHLAINNGKLPLAGVIAAAALAATAALAVLCFTKVAGLLLLGPGRNGAKSDREPVHDAGPSMRYAQVLLAAFCCVAGLAGGPIFSTLMTCVRFTPTRVGLDIALPGTGLLPTPSLLLVLAAITGGLLLLRRNKRTVVVPTWICGQTMQPSLEWTSAGFTQPLRLTLQWFLRARSTFNVVSSGGVVQRASYRGEVRHLVDVKVYGPVIQNSLKMAARLRKIQSGSIQGYALYLAAVVMLLLLLVRTGILL